MIIPLIIGGALLFSAFAMAKKKDATQALPSHEDTSVWTYVFKSAPMMAAKDVGAVSASLAAVVQALGGEVLSGDSPSPNLITVTARFKNAPSSRMGVGGKVPVGPYTMTVQSLTQAPAY